MKILHLISSLAPRFGGPSKACLEMAKATAKRGHEVHIYTTNMDGPQDMDVPLNKSVNVDGVKISYFQVNFPRFWKPSLKLAKALKKDIQKFDIVHIHSLYLFHNMVGGYYCRKYKIPYIVRPHGTLDPFLYKRHRFRKAIMELLFENKNMQKAAAIHYTTEEEKLLAQKHTGNSNSIIIPNGINIEDYSKLPPKGHFKKQYPETQNKRIILFFSRLNFKKGLDILIPAYIKLAKKYNDLHLVLAGPDHEGLGDWSKNELQKRGLSTSGKHSRITITGILQGDNKLAVLNDSEIFVLPSYTENFGIAVVEAMACGLPVIISDKVNICREVVEDGAGIAGPCSVKWFLNSIENVIENIELKKRMKSNGLESVKNRFQWHTIAKSLESEYVRLKEIN